MLLMRVHENVWHAFADADRVSKEPGELQQFRLHLSNRVRDRERAIRTRGHCLDATSPERHQKFVAS